MGGDKKQKNDKKGTGKIRTLTAREESFAVEYVRLKENGAEAYRASKYSSDNMKDDTIYKKACLLLKKEHIRGRIEELKNTIKKDVEEKLGADLESTLKAIIKLANDAKSDAIKIKALDMLMKYHGGYRLDNEQANGNNDDGEDSIEPIEWI